ncbi:MAG: ABC transporter ATP-binding protein [Anaerolineales bacterium]
MTAEPIIQLEAVTKVYGAGEAQVLALKGIDLAIQPAEFVAVMGPSGSGKSTLMNIIGCLDRPSAGRYHLAGEDVSRLNRARLADVRSRKIGFIFQSFNLLRQATALENVLLPLLYDRHNRRSPKQREAAAREALEAVGLTDRARHRPNQLSGGQQQRVAIARALINNPALILADEPTGNLDTQSSEDILGLLHELHGRGRTIVMVTHEPDIAAHAQRTILVRDGLIANAAPSPAAASMPAARLPALAERA